MKKIFLLIVTLLITMLVTAYKFESLAVPFVPIGDKVSAITTQYTDANGADIITKIERNYVYGTSTYFDVTLTVTDAAIYVSSNNYIPTSYINYRILGETFYNNMLTIYHANSVSGVNYIIDGTVNAMLNYKERVYRTDINDYWWNYASVVATYSKTMNLYNPTSVDITQEWQNHTTELNTGGAYELNLHDLFVSPLRYQVTYGYYPTNYMQYKQVIIPEITGFTIKYTAKIDDRLAQSFTQIDYNQFGTAFGYYTTTNVRELGIDMDPSFSVSCGLSFTPPFVGCSGPSVSLSLQSVISSISNKKLHTSNIFYYNRSMIYDSVNSRISQDITNVKYYTSNTTVYPTLINKYFEYVYTSGGSGGDPGDGCELQPYFCIVEA